MPTRTINMEKSWPKYLTCCWKWNSFCFFFSSSFSLSCIFFVSPFPHCYLFLRFDYISLEFSIKNPWIWLMFHISIYNCKSISDFESVWEYRICLRRVVFEYAFWLPSPLFSTEDRLFFGGSGFFRLFYSYSMCVSVNWTLSHITTTKKENLKYFRVLFVGQCVMNSCSHSPSLQHFCFLFWWVYYYGLIESSSEHK